jgi:hypothetical protein
LSENCARPQEIPGPNPPPGSTLLASFEKSDFVSVIDSGHPLKRHVLPVVAARGTTPSDIEIRDIGTCFAVTSDGLALTARHVIEEAVGIASGSSIENFSPSPDGWWIGALYAIDEKTLDGSRSWLLLPVTRAHLHVGHDVGAIHLNLPVDTRTNTPIRLAIARLGLQIPNAGDLCFAIGYHGLKKTDGSGSEKALQLLNNFSMSRGHVEEVHFPQRDGVLMPYPCFRASAQFEGGMSGGPIMTQGGSIIGMVCKSYSIAPGEPQISYGALICSSLLLPIYCKKPDGTEGDMFFYEFMQSGAVVTDDSFAQLRIDRQGSSIIIDLGSGRRITAHP